MLLLNKYFDDQVSAGVTLRPADFTLTEDGYVLSADQRAYLAQYGVVLDRVVCCRQVHGDEILAVEKTENIPETILDGDAVVTACPGLAIGVRTADCLPVFIVDLERSVIAVIHAGWRSTQKRIVPKTLDVMRKVFQTSRQHVRVVLGPAISAQRYPVGPEFQSHFPEHAFMREGQWYFDVVGENKSQLEAAGIRPAQVVDLGICSFTDERCHSFRRDGVASGRMLSFMRIT